MARLDLPAPAAERPGRRWFLAGAGSLAAAAAIALVHVPTRSAPETGTWQARGGATAAADRSERDVSACRPTRCREAPAPAQGRIDHRRRHSCSRGAFATWAALPVFLLFFAVDSRDEVHWISPQYERAGTDPAATPLPVTGTERLLETAALLEDAPSGPLRMVAVVTETPAHVSDIESLPGADLDANGIARRLPGASVRETTVELRAVEGGAH